MVPDSKIAEGFLVENSVIGAERGVVRGGLILPN